jgi:site-specific recombinase XerD
MTPRIKKDKLTLYQRHQGKCKLPMSALDKCECVYWVRGWLRGKPVRESLDTRSLAMADLKRKSMLNPAPDPPSGGSGPRLVGAPASESLTIEAAEQRFNQFKQRSVSSNSAENYADLIHRFRSFAETHGILPLRHVTTDLIQAFMDENSSQWNLRTRGVKLTALRVFFNHAVDQDWIERSPAKKKSLRPPKAKDQIRKPFTHAEIERILTATDSLSPKRRIYARALVMLLLYSGMRISDATFLERSCLNAEGMLDYMVIKTGRHIDLPPWLHEKAIAALNALPKSRVYFFLPDRDDDYYDARRALLTGEEDFRSSFPKGFYDAWVARTSRLVYDTLIAAGLRKSAHKEAAANRNRKKIGNQGVCHRFRDTFAVNLLVSGVDVFTVSQFLGHANVKVTKDHYLKLIPGYREQMSRKTASLNYPTSAA